MLTIPMPRVPASLKRRLRIAYLYMRLASARRCIKHKRDGIDGMHAQIKRDEKQVKKWGEDIDGWHKEIARLECGL